MITPEDDVARRALAAARALGLPGVLATTGEEGLDLARSLSPTALLLDLRLPDQEGLVVLDQLKRRIDGRTSPVSVLGHAVDRARALRLGAFRFDALPAAEGAIERAVEAIREVGGETPRRVVVALSSSSDLSHVAEVLDGPDVAVVAVKSVDQALAALDAPAVACLVIDLPREGSLAHDLVCSVAERPSLHGVPVMVFGSDAADEPAPEADPRLSIVHVGSAEELLERSTMYLHVDVSQLSREKQNLIHQVLARDPALAGRLALVADDDVRNLFALTAVLEQHDMQVLYAENGHEALTRLHEAPGVDVALMDIMMPEMDGYEAIRRIRSNARYATLPIIAITAKAMKQDREKCLEAGASDYIAKPVDNDRLISLLRVWLQERRAR